MKNTIPPKYFSLVKISSGSETASAKFSTKKILEKIEYKALILSICATWVVEQVLISLLLNLILNKIAKY